MDVTTPHPSVSASTARWMRCRDAAEGQDAIKARGRRYLPCPDGFTNSDYDAYLARALFFNGTARTIGGLSGIFLRRPPVLAFPERLSLHLKDVTLSSMPLEGMLSLVVREQLTVGRLGVMLDVTTQQAAHTRPYWVSCRAEDIINWQTRQGRDGNLELSLLVLREEQSALTSRFSREKSICYRVYELTQDGLEVTVWKKEYPSAGTSLNLSHPGTWRVTERYQPTRRGERLQFIPFVCFGTTGIGIEVERPPLLDLVDVNISHYQSSADLEHGRFWTATPTAWITGHKGNNVFHIGAKALWLIPEADAKVGMLEFTGQGLTALERALQQKEALMASLGARLLEAQKRSSEAAETVRLRQSGDSATMQSIASALDIGFAQLLAWHAWWAGASDAELAGEVTFKVNRDFLEAPMTEGDLKSLLMALETGSISYDTFYYNLQQGEFARPGVSAEVERLAIESDGTRFGHWRNVKEEADL